jgi:hypothetical protein
MGWLLELIATQLIFAYVIGAILFVIWKVANPGKKW